jgi:hypothetical protein
VDYSSLFARDAPYRSARINSLFAYRHLRFGRGARLDMLNGSQDLSIGFEVSGLAGHGFGGVDGSTADFFANAGLFLGAGSGEGYGYLQALVESRRSASTGLWTNTIASARLRLYQRITRTQTMVVDGEYGAGRNTSRPFELGLGQNDGGVRGYAASHDAGGERAALKLEDRWYAGTIQSRVDVGFVWFVDAGRVWAGDVPFGTTSAVKVGVGAGVLAAAPKGSERTFRLDAAFPVSPDPYAGWVVRLTVVNLAQLGASREPLDVTSGRELVTTSSQFTYPR